MQLNCEEQVEHVFLTRLEQEHLPTGSGFVRKKAWFQLKERSRDTIALQIWKVQTRKIVYY